MSERNEPAADAAKSADDRDEQAKQNRWPSDAAKSADSRDDQAKQDESASDAALSASPVPSSVPGPAGPGESADEKAAQTPPVATQGDPLLDKAASATASASAPSAASGDEQLAEQIEPAGRKAVSDEFQSDKSDSAEPNATGPDIEKKADAEKSSVDKSDAEKLGAEKVDEDKQDAEKLGAAKPDADKSDSVVSDVDQDAEPDEVLPAEEIRRYDCSVLEQRTAGLADAASAIRKGKLVVIPTDTVYGIGADAFTPSAVNALLAAKGRGRDMPVPVLVGTVRAANALVDDLGPYGQDLIDAFWPGPLTIICHAGRSLRWDLGDTKGTVAVRMPLHPVALELLKDTGPMAVSSANRSGAPPATTAAEAEEQLGASVAVYLDGGRCIEATPSTIVDLTTPVPRVLRKGAIPVEKLKGIVGYVATDG